ncbi:DNA repair exonuclease [Patescibacteria group bacterium]|nr:DNA repair exonuclease [Patescibacteria group bacterium]
MVKFAHMSDVHLGGWKQQPMQELNLLSFKKSIEICIKEKVDFVLIAGDLFDSAFPPIEILKEAFSIFRKLHDSKIPCFIIAGSHDYSVSGKTFLDVLEKAGFCKNVEDFEERGGKLILNPLIYKGAAIYGYPGKTSSLEIKDLRRIELNDSPGLFKILMLHTTIDKVKGDLPIDSLETLRIPYADYYALGHIHIEFKYENFIYPGPVFPNNFQELEDLNYGRFCIIDTESPSGDILSKIQIKLKEVISFDIEINNSTLATEKIIAEIEKKNIEDKIVLLRLRGTLNVGKVSDIKFSQIEDFINNHKAYFFLRNTRDLKSKDTDLEMEIGEKEDTQEMEEETIENYKKQNISVLNKYIPQLIKTLGTEKQEGETTESFTGRILEESKKTLNF